MATTIETLKKSNGDHVLPRTRAKAVAMEDGSTVEAAIANLNNKVDAEHTHDLDDVVGLQPILDQITDNVNTVVNDVKVNYDESIIGLSVDGQVITYIKGDGSQHTFITQDTNTTYSLATDEVTGLTKLYATIGSAEDGTMTQRAIKTELDKKVGVTMDDSNDMLIFTI